MGTRFEEVINMALISIQDYKLDKLYRKDPDAFEEITQGFLLRGLPEFYSCRHSLDYDMTTKEFRETLTNMEISILADLWVYQWFDWHVNQVTQWELKMTPSDFKHYSEAENLKQKMEYKDRQREKFNQKIVDYQIANMDWKNIF